jgi:hypothetical protein
MIIKFVEGLPDFRSEMAIQKLFRKGYIFIAETYFGVFFLQDRYTYKIAGFFIPFLSGPKLFQNNSHGFWKYMMPGRRTKERRLKFIKISSKCNLSKRVAP